MARKTKEDAEATRSRLLDAAENVFWAKGVAGASLADVAQAAGMTRGAIYWHFKDKADLFQAMMARVTLPLEQALGALPSQRTQAFSLDGVLSVLIRVLEGVSSDEQMRKVFEIALFKLEQVGDMAPVRERRVDASIRMRAVVEMAIQDWARRADVVLVPPHDILAEGFCGLFDGLVHTWLLRGGGFDLVDYGKSAMAIYLKGMGLPDDVIKKM